MNWPIVRSSKCRRSLLKIQNTLVLCRALTRGQDIKTQCIRIASLQSLFVVNSCCRGWRFVAAPNEKAVQNENMVLVHRSGREPS